MLHTRKERSCACFLNTPPAPEEQGEGVEDVLGREEDEPFTDNPSIPSCALHTRAGILMPPSLDLHCQKPQGWHYQGRGRKGHFPSPQDSLLPCTIPARLPHALISLLPPHSQGYLRISEMKSSDAPGLSASFSLGLRTDS